MKFFNVGINDRKIFITFFTIVFLGKLSSDIFTVFISTELEIFVYKDFTSSESSYELFGAVSAGFNLLIK